MSRQILTPEFRVDYPSVFETTKFPGQDNKYGIIMMFDKKTNISIMYDLIKEVAKEKYGKDIPKNLELPFIDGDTYTDKDDNPVTKYMGCIKVTAKNQYQPGCVDANVQAIISKEDFYAGCYARAALTAYCWQYANKKGVSFSLQHVQKIKDGAKLTTQGDPNTVFDVVEGAAASPETSIKSAEDLFA